NSKLKFDFAPGVLIGDFAGPYGKAIVDLTGEVTAMLGEPIAFLPLAAAMVPGDRVAMAVEPAVPHASTIVAAIVKYLCDSGAPPGSVTILRTKLDVEAGAEDPRSQLPAELRELVTLE